MTNALAKELGIDGFPELWFDSYADRKIAYESPRIAECNIDSEQFVGAVTRLVTEPLVIIPPPASEKPVKVFLVAIGAPDVAWADSAQSRLTGLPGVVGYVRQRLVEQGAAPSSKIPELKIPVAGVAEVTFASEAELEQHAGLLAGTGADSKRTAIYQVEDFRFI